MLVHLEASAAIAFSSTAVLQDKLKNKEARLRKQWNIFQIVEFLKRYYSDEKSFFFLKKITLSWQRLGLENKARLTTG